MKHPNKNQPQTKPGKSAPRSPLTRREMLVTIGGAAVLYRLGDAVEGAPAQGPSANQPLPPGLYQPSLDHLTHALSSETRFPPVPAGTPTEYLRPVSQPFTPQSFNSVDFAVIRRMVEIILGEGAETGAAVDTLAEVAEWIDLVVGSASPLRAAAGKLSPDHRALAVAYFGTEAPVKQIESFTPDEICREGLAWLAEESQRRFGKPFLDVDHDSQLALIGDISDSRSDPSVENPGTGLFAFLKEETIRGFYTSRQGLKELDFQGNAFYPRSPGCSLAPKS